MEVYPQAPGFCLRGISGEKFITAISEFLAWLGDSLWRISFNSLIMVRMGDVLYRLMCLNTWSPAGGAVWGGCKSRHGAYLMDRVVEVRLEGYILSHLWPKLQGGEEMVLQTFATPNQDQIKLGTSSPNGHAVPTVIDCVLI